MLHKKFNFAIILLSLFEYWRYGARYARLYLSTFDDIIGIGTVFAHFVRFRFSLSVYPLYKHVYKSVGGFTVYDVGLFARDSGRLCFVMDTNRGFRSISFCI